MTITFIAAGSLATNNTTTTLPVVAPACNINDILICCLMNKDVTNTISPPDGTWTQIVQGFNDATTAAAKHQYAVFWKRATASNGTFDFTKATDDNNLFCGVIGVWRGVIATTDPLDATAAGVTETLSNTDNVSFPAFDPTGTDVHVVYVAFYGFDLTTYSAAMVANVNPACTIRWDLETGVGTNGSISCTSGSNDGTAIASRTWASNSTNNAANTGVVFALTTGPVSTVNILPSISTTKRIAVNNKIMNLSKRM
jgi:hypothetical protein